MEAEKLECHCVPSVGRLAKAVKPDMSDDQLDAYYTEDNLRKMLY